MWRWRLTDVAVWSTISVETTTTARYWSGCWKEKEQLVEPYVHGVFFVLD
jgi:hypothetical protein